MALTPAQTDRIVQTVLSEAAGEGIDGMRAVANVINNRAKSGQWSSDPSVVAASPEFAGNFQNTQGTAYPKGSKTYQTALDAVNGVFGGTAQDNTGGATYYFNPRTATNTGWTSHVQRTMNQTAQIGNHVFYSPTSTSKMPDAAAIAANGENPAPRPDFKNTLAPVNEYNPLPAPAALTPESMQAVLGAPGGVQSLSDPGGPASFGINSIVPQSEVATLGDAGIVDGLTNGITPEIQSLLGARAVDNIGPGPNANALTRLIASGSGSASAAPSPVRTPNSTSILAPDLVAPTPVTTPNSFAQTNALVPAHAQGASVPALVRLPSGHMVVPKVYTGSDGQSFEVHPDGSVTRVLQQGEIPGLVNPAKEAAAGDSTIVGSYIKHSVVPEALASAASSFAENAPAVTSAAATAAQNLGQGVVSTPLGGEIASGTNALTSGIGGFLQNSGLATLFGRGTQSAPSGAPAQAPAPSIPPVDGGSEAPWGITQPFGPNIIPMPFGSDNGLSPAINVPRVPQVASPRYVLNPAWTAMAANSEDLSNVVPQRSGVLPHGGIDAFAGVAGGVAPITPTGPVVTRPNVPKYIPAPQAQIAPAPTPPPVQLTQLLSGRSVPVGTTGSAQGGAYNFVVNADGSITNLTTGRVSAPAPQAAPANSNASAPGNSFLASRGTDTSGMSAGQVQNALAAALGGGQHEGHFGI